MTLMTYPSGKRVKVGRDTRGKLSAMQRVDACQQACKSGSPAIPMMKRGIPEIIL
jgi:hypothetical protein